MNKRVFSIILAIVVFLPISTCLASALPDLQGYSGYYNVVETSAYWGNQINLDFAIANYGDAAGPFNVEFFVSDNSNIDDGNDYSFGTIPFSGFDAWTAIPYSLPITLPPYNPIGGSSPYYIGIVIDSDNEVTESVETNNKNQGAGTDYDSLTILEPQPDLMGYNGDPDYLFNILNQTAHWDQEINLTFSVVNWLGTAGPFKIRFFLSDNDNINDGNDYVLGEINHSEIYGGYYSPLTGSIRLPPSNKINGSPPFYIGMVVDADDEVTESNETNNKNQGIGIDYDYLTILEPLPDLFGYGDEPDYAFNILNDSAYWGEEINLTFAIINQRGTSGNFTIGLFLSDDSNIDDGQDYLLHNFSRPGIQGGDYQVGRASFKLPPNNPIGGSSPYYIGMVIDTNNEIVESNETNNKNQGIGIDYDTVAIFEPLPDLVGYLKVPFSISEQSVYWGEEFNLKFSVLNQGGSFNAPYRIKFFLSNDTNISEQNDHLLDEYLTAGSLSGSYRTITTKLALPTKNPFSGALPYYIGMVIDAYNNIAESNETNNKNQGDRIDYSPIYMIPNIVVVNDGLPLTSQLVNFGKVPYSVNKSIELKNDGDSPLTISQNGIALNNGTYFSIISVTSDTEGTINLSSPATIFERDETWTISILCNPVGDGELIDGLTITSDDPDESLFTITLLAFGSSVQDIKANKTSIDFGSVHADGIGAQVGTEKIAVTNIGEAGLNISSIYLNIGTVYNITEIKSNFHGKINERNIMETNETWKITIQFDPDTPGMKSDTLTIISNDPDDGLLAIPITGIGINEADILVLDSTEPNNDLIQNFYPTLNDGAGNKLSSQLIIVKNAGTQALTISQISIIGTNGYSVASINSSITGMVTLPDSIDSAEDWSILLTFDPITNGNITDTLQIESNDPDESIISISLSGEAVQPTLTLLEPSTRLGVNAEQMYRITWDDNYTAGDALISLYLDPDTNPNNLNELAIVENLSENNNHNFYAWPVNSDLISNEYYIYAVISDGVVTNHSYSNGTILIEPDNAFHLLSPLYSTQSEYNYKYEYNSTIYGGTVTLAPGQNHIVAGNSTLKHDFYVTFYENTLDSAQYTYDEMNRIKTYTNGNEIIANYSYDKLGRLARIEYSTGAILEYTYDIIGNPLSIHDKNNYIFYTYDELSRITSVSYSEDAISRNEDDQIIAYNYDSASRLTEIVYPSGGAVEYVFDNAGRLYGVKDYTSGSLKTTNYLYNTTTGFLSQITRPNGVKTIYTYDGSARLVSIEHRNTTDTLIAEYHYEYDADGRRTELWVTTLLGTRKEKYAYDDLGQIIEVIYSDDDTFDINDKKVNYTYDGNGNRLSKSMIVNQVLESDYRYYYGHENRLLQMDERLSGNSTRFYYDPSGNRIMKITDNDIVQYTYDERNLLTSAIKPGKDIKFEYDAIGNRKTKTINGEKTDYVTDALSPIPQVIEEHNGDQLGAYYTYGISRISTTVPGESDLAYYLEDALGSTRYVINEAGNIGNEYIYDVFGNLHSGPTMINEYWFTGERVDLETGLIYLRSRYYDPQPGVFITKDPIGILGGFNPYSYVNNDPINKVDPLGLQDYQKDELMWVAAPPNLMQSSDVKTNTLGDIIIDFFADRSTQGRAIENVIWSLISGEPLPTTQWGGTGRGRNAEYGFIIYHSNKVYEQGQWAFVRHDYRMQWANNKYGVNALSWWHPAVQEAHWKLVVESPWANWGIKVLFSGMVGIGKLMNLAYSMGEALLGGFEDSDYEPVLSPYEPNQKKYYDDFFPPPFDPCLFDPLYCFGLEGAAALEEGGVILGQTAHLISSSLSDIKGATYDPQPGQVIFIGTNDPAATKDIEMDYFLTAIKSIYGSSVPPLVSLQNQVSITSPLTDDNGNGIVEPGETAALTLNYHPVWVDEDNDMQMYFYFYKKGEIIVFNANLNAWADYDITQDGRPLMAITLESWTNMPNDIEELYFTRTSYDLKERATVPLKPGTMLYTQGQFKGEQTFGALENLELLNETCSDFNPKDQDSYYELALHNNGTENYTLLYVEILSDKHERMFGGRIDNTKLGWVIFEADRILKNLITGVNNLNLEMYNSTTVPITGFKNIAELEKEKNISRSGRAWFSTNDLILKRYIDENTKKATVLFDNFSVKLNFEYRDVGLDFASHFNEHYDEFAALNFSVRDPFNPESIIEVPIFEMYREAMQAAALARFFYDNKIPIDREWLNTWQPPIAYPSRTTAIVYNEAGGIYGGAIFNKPNSYIPASEAKNIGELVKSQQPAAPEGSDILGQIWEVNNTIEGDLIAVAASLAPTKQNNNIKFAEFDLSFDSPSRNMLAFGRYYSSTFLGENGMGPGWNIVPLALEFSSPSWYDEHGLIKNSTGQAIWSDQNYDTHLRSGEIRFMNYVTGKMLNFYSSFSMYYDIDNIGDPLVVPVGLDENGFPTFMPGEWKDGSTLQQTADDYILSLPDNSKVTFDHMGKLLKVIDKHNYSILYNHNSKGMLEQIKDDENQTLDITYNTDGKVESVAGPYLEKVVYIYDAGGRLINVNHTRSGSTITYTYNGNSQLTSITPSDGVTRIIISPDLKGRIDDYLDKYGNTYNYSFQFNQETEEHVTAIKDTDSLSQATWTNIFDDEGRLIERNDPSGNAYEYNYYTDSKYPNVIKLPVEGRSSIEIERNAYGQIEKIRDPELISLGGKETIIAYNNETNLPISITDSLGRVSEFTYNENNDVIAITRYLNEQPVQINLTYQNGYLHTITDPSGKVMQIIGYDNLGRISNLTDSAGITTSYLYDSLGRLWKMSNPSLNSSITYIYNDFDQVTQINTPSGSILYDYYPNTQWLKRVTSPKGSIQEYLYNNQTGDIIKIKQITSLGKDVEVDYSYNRLGHFAGLTMPENQTVSFEYDDLRRVTKTNNSNYHSFALTQPDGINDKVSESFTIKWVDEDTNHSAIISLYYDTDNTGEDGTLIVNNIEEDDETDAFEWDTSALEEGDYYIYAVVDNGQTPVTHYSSGPVKVNHSFSINISLHQGWNLISIPISLLNKTLPFKSIEGNYSHIFTYYGQWEELNDGDEVNETIAMWIRMNNEEKLEVRGFIHNKTTPFHSGWNLITHPSLKEEIITGDKIIYSYNGTWSSYIPNRTQNSLEKLKPGYGYWLWN